MIERLTDAVVAVIGLEGRLAESVSFFLYDSIKIIFLLWILIFVIGILRSYIPRKKMKKWFKGTKGYFMASVFGAITPFCSCSSIPIFIGLLRTIPLGVAFSFLVTSPLINQYLVVIMLGTFGLKITLYYVISGILIGTFSGMILGKLGLEKYLEKDIQSKKITDMKFNNFKERIDYGLDEAKSIVAKVWLWVLLGVGIGAVLHGYVPEESIQALISKTGVFTVPIAVIAGIPLYANCAAIIPVAVVLFEKGVPLGTALAFMMSTAALSLPEAIILKRAMKIKLIIIFFAVVGLAIILMGYLFNFSTFL